MRIKYVGLKAVKKDNVAGTGLQWVPDQVHEVSDAVAAAKLLAYPLIWGEAKEEKAAAPAPAPKAPAAPKAPEADADTKAEKGTGEAAGEAAGELPIEQVRQALKDRGIAFHPKTGDAKLRTMLAAQG